MRAKYFEVLVDSKVKCTLCPEFCVISPNRFGKCKIRFNNSGVLEATQWGQLASSAVDPIEKKPLYHFFPATEIFSVGGYGCNLSCMYCQNWQISTKVGYSHSVSVEELIAMVKRSSVPSIAFTYNEPLVNFEYYLEVARQAKESGIRTVLVTNGYINPAPLAEILPYIDAANIDLKAIRNEFYKELCGGSLTPVLQTITSMIPTTHIELTCLIIPTMNDSDEEIVSLGEWVKRECGRDMPLHISAYFPSYKADFPPTPLTTLKRAYSLLKNQLDHVYIGNVESGEWSNTKCVKCSSVLISRSGYSTDLSGIENGRCRNCGSPLDFLTLR